MTDTTTTRPQAKPSRQRAAPTPATPTQPCLFTAADCPVNCPVCPARQPSRRTR